MKDDGKFSTGSICISPLDIGLGKIQPRMSVTWINCHRPLKIVQCTFPVSTQKPWQLFQYHPHHMQGRCMVLFQLERTPHMGFQLADRQGGSHTPF